MKFELRKRMVKVALILITITICIIALGIYKLYFAKVC